MDLCISHFPTTTFTCPSLFFDGYMATADTGKLERLPLELWENIVEQLPVLDILELKQVRGDA